MTDTTPVSIRLTEAERAEIARLAETERRSIANMLVVLINEALEARELVKR